MKEKDAIGSLREEYLEEQRGNPLTFILPGQEWSKEEAEVGMKRRSTLPASNPLSMENCECSKSGTGDHQYVEEYLYPERWCEQGSGGRTDEEPIAGRSRCTACDVTAGISEAQLRPDYQGRGFDEGF